jgi:pimeloyl-ACP methyl ester carboxylesterase
MPLPPEGIDTAGQLALLYEGGDRVQTAITWLAARDMIPVTVIAHSRGCADILFYAATHDSAAVTSLVLVGANGRYENLPDAASSLGFLQDIKLPILDLYGEHDLEGVIKTAPERRKAAAGNPGYQQIMVPGADHFFDGKETSLLAAVTRWLDNHP